jgi:hypothetical protein
MAVPMSAMNGGWTDDVDAADELIAPTAGDARTLGDSQHSLTSLPGASEDIRMLEHFVSQFTSL